MFLDATTRKLQVVLNDTVTTNQLPCSVDWVDFTATTTTPGFTPTNTNNITAVDICAAPGASTQRKINGITLFNADTVSATATIRYNDNGVTYTLVKATLAVGDALGYTDATGWRVTTVEGVIKTSGSGGVSSVGQTFTGGLVSVSGSPITTSGTLALTVAGTSGGIPYFSGATTWATSAALAANALVVGGGAGAAPSTVTTGTGILTALGVNIGSAGAPVTFNGAGGTPSSITLTNGTGLPATGVTGTALVAADIGVATGNVVQVNQAVTAWTRAATTTLGTTLNGTLSDTSTTITAFAGVAGVTYHVRALGAGAITHHATDLIITQTGASIAATAAGDTFDVEMLTATTARIKNYLKADGTALVAATGGSWIYLSTVTASDSATVDVETTFDATYDNYVIVGTNVVLATNATSFDSRLKITGAYSATNYVGHYTEVVSATATYLGTANVTTSIRLGSDIGNVTNEGINFTAWIFAPSGTTLLNRVHGDAIYIGDSAPVKGGHFIGANTVAGAVTGVRFLAGSGNITSGTFRLYGIKNS